MPKRPSKSDDPTVFAKNVLDEINAKHDAESATEEAKKAGKNPAAVALGRPGRLNGGKARAEKLSERKRKRKQVV